VALTRSKEQQAYIYRDWKTVLPQKGLTISLFQHSPLGSLLCVSETKEILNKRKDKVEKRACLIKECSNTKLKTRNTVRKQSYLKIKQCLTK